MKPKVAQVVFGIPVDSHFDYSVPDALRDIIAVGQRVEAPFHYRRLIGYVVGLGQRSRFGKLKPLLSVLDPVPLLDRHGLEFSLAFAARFACSQGEAIETILPEALRTRQSLPLNLPGAETLPREEDHDAVILCHDEGMDPGWPFLVEQMRGVLDRGQSVLFLVPEISSFLPVGNRIRAAFQEPVTVLDRQLSRKEEMENWAAVKEGRSRIVIGTRSAVFAPLVRPGLIVMYEEENPAYQQEQTPFYHARDAALLRAQSERCPVLFVSSAPSAELWHLTQKKNGRYVNFKAGHLARVQIIDLTNYKTRKKASISFPLQNSIRDVLQKKGKVVLLHNRRGFSTMLLCDACGQAVTCSRCDAHLAFIYKTRKLLCPLCHTTADLPEKCPACRTAALRYLGAGIEKVESETARFFPEARVARFDGDTASWPRDADIVIATQAVLRAAPGTVMDLIAVLDIDSALSRVDFRCSQKVFSLLVRLRRMARETLMIQTYWRDHDCFQAAAEGDFQKFYKGELKSRKECRLPPFVHLVAFGLRGAEKERVAGRARAVYEKLKEALKDDCEVLEPQPDIIPKLRDKYRFTIMVKGTRLAGIIPAIRAAAKSVRNKGRIVETIHVDP